ncbi:hypothetical protein SC09_Contig19orf00869 [Bacillus subtilis]|uniref:Uncharacterized protein n=1 Tax=Bacillus subtilis TaxID=1423 RepID=A0A0D1L972_BACIU|nr:hypothetical protein SC09_Contig19orf00869 [Bacillus subtilis]
MTPIDYGHAGLHHKNQKKVLTKLQKVHDIQKKPQTKEKSFFSLFFFA